MYTTFRALWTASVALRNGGHWSHPAHFSRLWFHGLKNYRLVSQLYAHTGLCNISRLIAEKPHFLGVLVWPLVDRRWGASRRLSEVISHYREAARVGDLLDFRPEDTRILLSLGSIYPELTLCLERPSWFDREGQLTLSLFHAQQRVYSIAFQLSRGQGRRIAYIGAVQGVKQAPESDMYKSLTKAAHGMRPRDLTIALFLLLCKAIRVDVVLAVQDKNRQHRHRYFGASGMPEVVANYDAIWSEHEARLGSDGLYVLLPGFRKKDLAAVASKRRSMYRKRHDFLSSCQTSLDCMAQASYRPEPSLTFPPPLPPAPIAQSRQ